MYRPVLRFLIAWRPEEAGRRWGDFDYDRHADLGVQVLRERAVNTSELPLAANPTSPG